MEIKINQSVYLCISPDYNFSYFSGLSHIIEGNYSSGNYISEIKHSKVHTTHSGNNHKLYDLHFLDQNGNPKVIERNSWKLNKIYNGQFGFPTETVTVWGVANGFVIEAPNGELKVKYFSMYLGENGRGIAPLNALKFFHSVSNYSNWREFYIRKENEELKAEIEKLKNKINELSSM